MKRSCEKQTHTIWNDRCREKHRNAFANNKVGCKLQDSAKMTGVLLKQYLNGELSDFENYKIEQNKLIIALARIGDQIEERDKQKNSLNW